MAEDFNVRNIFRKVYPHHSECKHAKGEKHVHPDESPVEKSSMKPAKNKPKSDNDEGSSSEDSDSNSK